MYNMIIPVRKSFACVWKPANESHSTTTHEAIIKMKPLVLLMGVVAHLTVG